MKDFKCTSMYPYNIGDNGKQSSHWFLETNLRTKKFSDPVLQSFGRINLNVNL